ncbi:MAG TPA: NAD+ synthase [Planctomycetes bacterium]|nr:NAD+ synthase [Planctomycetota bacterium]
MRIAIAQLNLTIGAFDAIFHKIEAAAEKAQAGGASLLCLSELVTCGYPPRDLLLRTDFVQANLKLLARVAALSSEDFAILLGYAEPRKPGPGKDLYNAAALCLGGSAIQSTHKSLLPTYDVFDESRYFEPGEEPEPMELFGRKLGVTLCEDIWNEPGFVPQGGYDKDPVEVLVRKGADLLINLSASPFHLGKRAERQSLLKTQCLKHQLPLVYANQVGANDELIFDGCSLVLNEEGEVMARALSFEEDLLLVDLPSPGKAMVPQRMEPIYDHPPAEAVHALTLGLRDYVEKCGFEKVLLGLSGGIDSALTAAIAVRALSKEQVLGVGMPGPYSSQGSVDDARALARHLGIAFELLPIDEPFSAFLQTLSPLFAGLAEDVTEENLQARIRGVLLMALSNKFGHLLLTTGNKSETSVGYCTLYGDMNGGLAVISDVPKTLVYDCARWLNREREVIPEATIQKPPSAELRPGQTDQDSLPPYDVLDPILEAFVEEGKSAKEIVDRGFDEGLVARVIGMVTRAEYKRRQAAPGLRITSKAFGVGRRYPIAASTKSLL